MATRLTAKSDGERVIAEAAQQIGRERHERQRQEEGEIAPRQSLAMTAHRAEDPMMDQPELGDDDEGDEVADQLASVHAERMPKLAGRVHVEVLGCGDLQLEHEKRQGNRDDAVGQG
jgi:hypothetical protein